MPTPPTPVSVTSERRAHELGDVGDDRLASDQRRQLLWEVAREVVDAAEDREVERESVGDDLVHRHAAVPAAQPVLAQRPQRDAVAQQHLRRVGDEHLAAVGQRQQPGGAAHLAAHVGLDHVRDRVAGVQAHPDREVDDRVVAQLLL